ncbi:alanine racemase [soil metagenome]
MLQFPQRPTRADIDLAALDANYRSIKAFVGDNTMIMAVVKANAYGHGSVECSRVLIAAGVDWLGVALVEEAIELRSAGIDSPILCLSGVWPGQEQVMLAHDLTPAIFRIEDAHRLDAEAKKANRVVQIHVKVDTGMGRVGVRADEFGDFLDGVAGLGNIRIDGLMSHFASADDPAENEFTDLQISEFESAIAILRSRGIEPSLIDLANSPGSICHPKSRGTMVRIGGIFYGLGDDVIPRDVPQPELQPVMSVRSKVALVKDIAAGDSVGYGRQFVAKEPTKVATVPIGYHDGYRRALGGQATAIIKGIGVPVIGTVSMDWITIDVTQVHDVKVGDEVVLLGSAGNESVSAADLAKIIGSISYEITCGIGERVPRNYIKVV